MSEQGITTIEEDPINGLDSTQQAMAADGLAVETPRQQSYFGFSETKRHMLPDGVSFIDYQVMNEGARRKYLDQVSSDVRIQKGSGDAIMRMQQGKQRKALLEESCVGWNLIDAQGQPVSFSKQNFNKWLDQADPRIVDKLELDVQKANPWLMAEMTVEDIDKQIEELQELRAKKIAEEEGNAS